MPAKHRRTTALFALLAAAALAHPVTVARAQSNPQVVKPQETVNLTMEQRHIIKEIILKDLKVTPPADHAAQVPTKVGDVVPSGIPLQPMPVEVSAKVPQLKSHSFLVKDDKVVVIDPKDNKVAALIE
jgi:hypothetical protein